MEQKDADKLNAGIYYDSFEKLGAHPMTLQGTEGTFFAVWAPNAVRVSVVGDFNHWDGRRHQMRKNQECGVFELFIPDVLPGECYKYEIKSKGDVISLKADPYAFGQQLRPETASIVREISSYEWQDKEWMKEREKRQTKDAPVSVCEGDGIHLCGAYACHGTSPGCLLGISGDRILCTYFQIRHC